MVRMALNNDSIILVYFNGEPTVTVAGCCQYVTLNCIMNTDSWLGHQPILRSVHNSYWYVISWCKTHKA